VSAEERARISREAAERRAARDAAANAAAAAVRAAQAAAAREAAERAAMVERARINDEQHRLMLAAQRQAASDNRPAPLDGAGAGGRADCIKRNAMLKITILYRSHLRGIALFLPSPRAGRPYLTRRCAFGMQ
jgi:hypothetical protein